MSLVAAAEGASAALQKKQVANTNGDTNHANGTNGGAHSIISLQRQWDWWFDGAVPRGASAQQYEKSVKHLGTFASVQDFWRYWNNFETTKFPDFSNLRLFKKGVKPKWEDPENQHGGKFMVNVSKQSSARVFLELVLGVIGEEFPRSDDVCGLVLSVRPRMDVLAIWNRRADDVHAMQSIRAELDRLFPADAQINYVLHNPGTDNKTPVVLTQTRGSTPTPPATPSTTIAPTTPVTPLAHVRQIGRSPANVPLAASSPPPGHDIAHRRSISYSGPSRRSRKRSTDITRLLDEDSSEDVTFQQRLQRNATLTSSAGPGASAQRTPSPPTQTSSLEIFEPDELGGDSDSDDALQIPPSRRDRLADTDSRFKWQRFHEQNTGGATTRRRAVKSANATTAAASPAAAATTTATTSTSPASTTSSSATTTTTTNQSTTSTVASAAPVSAAANGGTRQSSSSSTTMDVAPSPAPLQMSLYVMLLVSIIIVLCAVVGVLVMLR